MHRPETPNNLPKHRRLPAFQPAAPRSCHEIASIDQARALVAQLKAEFSQVESVEQIHRVAAKASLLHDLATRAKFAVEICNEAAEVSVRAKHLLGTILQEMIRRGGNRRRVEESALTLEDIGVSKFESSQCRKLAVIPRPKLDEYIEALKAARQPIYVNSVLRRASVSSPEKATVGHRSSTRGRRTKADRLHGSAQHDSLQPSWMRPIAEMDELLENARNHLSTLQGIVEELGTSSAPERMRQLADRYLDELADCLERLRAVKKVLAGQYQPHPETKPK